MSIVYTYLRRQRYCTWFVSLVYHPLCSSPSHRHRSMFRCVIRYCLVESQRTILFLIFLYHTYIVHSKEQKEAFDYIEDARLLDKMKV